MKSRRKFIRNSALLTTGTMLAPLAITSANSFLTESSSLELKKSKKMGVQAYSVRQALAKDFSGSMKRIADIGYSYIEAYGLTPDGKMAGASPTESKNIIDDLGMELVSSHSSLFYHDQAEKVIDIAHKIGLKYLVVSGVPGNLRNDYYKVADILNETGEKFKGSGVTMCYHNHAFEFNKINGEVPYEIMLKETETDLVSFEADLYWVVKGKADPLDLIKRYPGRFSLFHIKDSNSNLEQVTVGEGIIDFQSILKNKEKAGLDYYFVEDEQENDPFGNLEKAFNHMNKLKN